MLAPFHCVKMPGTPVEALDLVEKAIFQLSGRKEKTAAALPPPANASSDTLTALPATAAVLEQRDNVDQEQYFPSLLLNNKS